MAESLALSKDFLSFRTWRRTAEFIARPRPILLVCLGYYAGAWIAKELRFPDSHLSLIWPPTAMLLAGLLLAPLRKWWIYLLAVVPVHILVQWQDGVATWGILSQLIGNYSQALLAAGSVRYFNEGPQLNSFRAIAIFVLGAILFAPAVVSTIAAYLYVLSGWEQNYWYAWRARVLSNALSTLMIVPPIILLCGRDTTGKSAAVKPKSYIEASVLVILLVLTSSVSFGKEVEELLGVACPIILPLPVLLWSALRFGLGGLCFSTLLVAYFAFASTATGLGFFAMSSPAANVLSVQFYLIVTTVPLMMLAGLMQEREQKEQTLRESEARYRALVMASSEAVWQANAWGEGLFVTPSWQELTGQDANQMREYGWLQAVHPDDRERAVRLWERAMLEKRAYENELRIRASDGSYRYFYVHAVPILAPNGNVHEWVGANVDISERKQAEQALQDLVAGTGVAGEEFFPAYVRHVAAALDVYCAIVAEVADEQNSRLRTLAIWVDQRCEKNYEYAVADAPCGRVLREEKLFYCRQRVQDFFPECRSLRDLNAVSYMGAPLFNTAGQLIGSLCIIDTKPIDDERRAKSILEIFAARAAAEIERKRAEEALRRNEEELKRALREVQRLKERLEAENVYLRSEVSEAYRDREIIGKSERIVKYSNR
jgi:PAS domain S-box-containing protein